MTTRIEAVIDRLRALPEAEQEMLAGEIEGLLMEPASLLTAEQWREVEVEIVTAHRSPLSAGTAPAPDSTPDGRR